MLPFYVLIGCLPKGHRFVVEIEEPPSLQGEVPVYLGERKIGEVVARERETGKPSGFAEQNGAKLRLVVEVPREEREKITLTSRFRLRRDPEDPDRWRLVIEPHPGKPIPFGQVVRGEVEEEGFFTRFLRQLRRGIRPLKKAFRRLTEEVDKLPKSPEFEAFRRDLETLSRELKEVEEKTQEELLPKLQRELDRLERELKKLLEERKEPDVERSSDLLRSETI